MVADGGTFCSHEAIECRAYPEKNHFSICGSRLDRSDRDGFNGAVVLLVCEYV